MDQQVLSTDGYPASADVAVVLLQGLDHVGQRQVELHEQFGIDDDMVLLFQATP